MSTTDEPLPDTPWPTASPGSPGLKIGFPGAHELASPAHRISHRVKIIALMVGLGVLTLTLVVVALLATPGPVPNCKPLSPGCQGPPIGHGGDQSATGPAESLGIPYRNAEEGFTVRYPPQPSVQTYAQGIELNYDFTDAFGGPSSIEIFGGPAGSQTPQTEVQAFASKEFPSNTQPVYELPNPLIGYQPAFGAAFDVQPASANGSTSTDQVVVAAAVDKGFLILVQLVGTFIPPSASSKAPFFNNHPSPAGNNVAYSVGDFILNRIGFP